MQRVREEDEVGVNIQVNDFHWEPGKNDAEYIKLLESSRDEWKKLTQKAIAKLKALSKALEPMVLTLDEVRNNCPDCVYVETKTGWLECAIQDHGESDKYDGFFVYGIDEYFMESWDIYGKWWRCWSAKPTDGERKAVAWNE